MADHAFQRYQASPSFALTPLCYIRLMRLMARPMAVPTGHEPEAKANSKSAAERSFTPLPCEASVEGSRATTIVARATAGL